MLCGRRVVHVAGRDDAQAALHGKGMEHVVVGAVEGVAVIEQLDDDVVGAEEGDEPVELGGGAG